jgi:EAL domain-containing protein (putative c-di-GMP-specific phosphodiesterase class I)
VAEEWTLDCHVIYLKDLGCFSAQGYFHARPVPPDGFNILVEENEEGTALALPPG